MTNKSRPGDTSTRAAERRGNVDGYTEYGYKLDGIEYATVGEAYEGQQ